MSFRGADVQVPHVPQDKDYWFPLCDDHFFRAELPRCILEQGGGTEIRIERHEVGFPVDENMAEEQYPAVQLYPTSVLAAELHGCLYLVAALRRRKK